MTTTFHIKCATPELENLYKSQQRHFGDSGIDIYFPETVPVLKGARGQLIDLGISVEAITNDKPTSFFMIPRSSIYKTPLRLANSIGLVDAMYRGNLKAAVDNVMDTDYLIEKGTRLFQIVNPNLSGGIMTVNIVKEHAPTSRGTGGFGSTGV